MSGRRSPLSPSPDVNLWGLFDVWRCYRCCNLTLGGVVVMVRHYLSCWCCVWCLNRNTINVGVAGIALTYAVGVIPTLEWFIQFSLDVESRMNMLERLMVRACRGRAWAALDSAAVVQVNVLSVSSASMTGDAGVC